MNKIYNISKSFVSRASRIGRMLSILFLLALSSNAWADGYYLRYIINSSNENFSASGYAWSLIGSQSGSKYSWTLSIDDVNIIYLSSSTDETSYSGLFTSHVSSKSYDDPVTAVYNIQNHGGTSTERKGYKVEASSACVVKIIYDNSANSLTIVPLSWRLCGEFTDWDPSSAPEFTGSGTSLSTSVYLPYNHTYRNGYTNEGFRVVGYVEGSEEWYGNTGQMTSGNCSNWTFEKQSKESNTYNCGIVTGWSGYYTFTFDTSTKKLSVSYPDPISSTPIAYWGAAPAYGGDAPVKDIVASAYIASQGCGSGSQGTVDQIKVRYWKKGESSNMGEKTLSSGPYAINTANRINIPFDDDILLNCVTESIIVMEVAAHNTNGWSAYSDQMEFAYTANHAFVTNNLSGDTYTQCDGKHQFVLKDMVKPMPDSWSATLGGSDATADFTLTDDGLMVWNPSGKTAGAYTYTFTFDKTVGGDDYPTVQPTLSFTYQATPITGDITNLTASSTSVYPWDDVTLTSTYPNTITKLKWSVDKTSGYNLTPSAMGETSTTAAFKGSTIFASTVYNVKVQGTNDDCVTTAGQSVAITVNEDTDPCATATLIKIGADPVLEEGPRATLSGYLKYRGNGSGACVTDYTTYGFCYSTTKSKIDAATPDFNDADVKHKYKTGAALTENNRNWTYTISEGLAEGTYYYKPYIMQAGGTKKFGSVTGSFTIGSSEKCDHPTGDVINYYIDDDYDENDPCALKFKTIAGALANLKTHTGSDNDDWWGSDMLKVNVVFNVYPGTYDSSDESSVVNLSEINKYSSATTPVKRLTIMGTDPTNKPIIHGLYMAKSRWITVQNVRVERKTKGSNLDESSILIGFDDESNGRTVGELANGGLEFIKCDIEVDGFTCIHGNGVDGFYMTGCNLIADRTETITDNDRNWGASIKFMNSKNIRMLRNNFRGSHANNIFFQNSRETLIMNNVFWNDNKITYSSTTNNPSFIRLVNFQADNDAHNITKVGIYYNTFYLANSDAADENLKHFDFVAFGGGAQGGINTRFEVDKIHFMYNNCYSYSTLNTGNSGAQFGSNDISDTFKYNNFWSAKSAATTTTFAFGTDYSTVDMSLTGGMICSTAPYDPDGLVIRGNKLNLGSKIETDASGLGAESISDDRLRVAYRPASGNGWTYGAYQQTLGVDVHEIYWRGTENTDWSNRNNWYKLIDGEYQLVTCVDVLSDDLKAVILEQTGDVKKYPIIPVWEDTHEGYYDEGVYTATTNKFAKTIDVQYGASILGVENLKESDGTYRYFEGINHLDAGRKEWLMVGTVICPFNDYTKAVADADTTSRLIISNDFYRDHLPHVYMQQFEYVSGSPGSINWDAPFTQLDESVPYDKSFTIFCADQYGPKKRTAAMYYGDASKGSEPIKYEFKGRYAAEKLTGKPVYAFTAGSHFVNNYYPANVDIQAFNNDDNTVQYYDVKTGGWNPVVPATERDVTPQSGVFLVAAADNNVDLDGHFTTNSTKYKSASVNQGLTLFAYSTATGKGSNAGAWQDYKNITKAENASDPDVCELYILHGGVNLSALSYQFADTVIALGVNNKLSTSMSVKFELLESYLLDEIYLEDRAADPVVRYDLMSGEKPYFANLPSGRTEGRFYLVIGDGQSTEPDVPTEVPAEKTLNFNIDAFVNNSVLTVSVGADATISSITMYDMAGRVYTVPVNGKNFSQSELTVAKGIYTVTVVTDRGTETKKVVVK